MIEQSKESQIVKPNETRIVFVRHGESLGNMQGTFLGHTDLDLSPRGYEQAECACRYLEEHFRIDVIYASDLMRAWHTVAPLAERLHQTIIKTTDLREICAGEWEQVTFDDISIRYKGDYDRWCHDFGNAVCTGGEAVAHLRERVRKAVECIAAENRGKTVCIGAHATPIRLLMGVWQGLPIERAGEIAWPVNASVTVARYRTDGTVTVEKYAEASFLGTLKNTLNFGKSEH